VTHTDAAWPTNQTPTPVMAAVVATTAMLAAATITERKGDSGSRGGGGTGIGVRDGGGENDDDDDGGAPNPAPAAAQQHQQRRPADLLDTTVAYLKQREGIDKTLKTIRYAARLVAAAAAASPSGGLLPAEAGRRAEALQQALGGARKAYRLGKFLERAAAWRDLPALDYGRCLTDGAYRAASRRALLERLAAAGEGLYYFLDQAAFYFSAGAFGEPRKGLWQRRLSRLSAWSESVAYACGIALGLEEVRRLGAAEAALRGEMVAQWRRAAAGGGAGVSAAAGSARALAGGSAAGSAAGPAADGGGGGGAGAPPPPPPPPPALDPRAVARLRQLRRTRALRAAAVAQDAADALLALSDLLEGRGGAAGRALSHPALLALCGLLSAAVSTRKHWGAAAKAAKAAKAASGG